MVLYEHSVYLYFQMCDCPNHFDDSMQSMEEPSSELVLHDKDAYYVSL